MNLDNFREEVAVKHNRTLNQILYLLAWVIMVVCTITAMANLTALVGGAFRMEYLMDHGLPCLICAVIAVLIWKNKDELRVEYDYTFTNGDLDVGKVFGNSRRKLMTSLAMKNVEAAGPVTDKGFIRFRDNKDVKKHNWFVNRDAHLYYFYFVKNEIRHAIILELSPDMVKMLKPYLGFGVWQG